MYMNEEVEEFLRRLVKLIFSPPAVSSGTDKNGNKYWLNAQKQLHRKIGPAVIAANGQREWMLNGKPFRLCGPEIIDEKDAKFWLDEDRQAHRLGGPAAQLADGTKIFSIHGKITAVGAIDLKRRGNTEIITYPNSKEWKKDGKFHREDGPAIEEFNESLKLQKKEWWNEGKRHRIDGPAVEYSDNEPAISSMGRKEWWLNGELHRDHKPAIIYTKGGENWYKHGKLHREDGPAKTTPFRELTPGKFWGQKKWFIDGKLHRTDGPAIELADGTKKWYRNGDQHRKDGPAVEAANGDKEWWLDGAPHREDGPAIDTAHLKKWYRRGKLHREDGPAIERIYGGSPREISREWYRDGKRHRDEGPAVDIGDVPEKLLQRAKANPQIPAYHDSVAFMRFEEYGANKDYPRRERNYGDKEWWVKGKLHRENAPAIERIDGSRRWFHWGRLHREVGPAVTHPNGSTEWWLKGRLHRISGPAVEVADGYAIYHAYGDHIPPGINALRRYFAEEWHVSPLKYHPPSKCHTGTEWWIKGEQLSEEDFSKRKEVLRRKTAPTD